MKTNLSFYFLSLLVFSLLLSCKKDFDKVVPTVKISAVTNFTTSSGTCFGEITADGGAKITERGFCWGIVQNPTTANDKTIDGSGIGSFTRVIIGLSPGTTYNIRAYAVNSEGTNYSSQTTFTTLALAPVLTTVELTSVTSTTAICGGNITADGGAPVTARGVCWSMSQNPGLTDSKTTDGAGSGVFISSITGLMPGITYYFKAYATNSIGTAYGNQVSIQTPAVLPKLTTDIVTNIAENTATCGGDITDQGGAVVISSGVCWSTSQNPTIKDNKSINGSGLGNFTCNLSDLTPNTTYYLRAFATNSAGTGYGNEVSFQSLEPGIGTVTDMDGNVYHTVTIGTQVWMKENLKTTKFNDGTSIPFVTENSSWVSLFTPGYCWYNNEVANKNIYGALYNWHAVNTGKICPKGWHVPTDAEWTTLTTFLGGEIVAGGKLKETGTTHWNPFLDPEPVTTNETGFTALPGGLRLTDGKYYNIGDLGFWWSSTDDDTTTAWIRAIRHWLSGTIRSSTAKENGFSVRCLRD